MTEDNTFRILKRMPYLDARLIYLKRFGVTKRSDRMANNTFEEETGWTFDELIAHARSRAKGIDYD